MRGELTNSCGRGPCDSFDDPPCREERLHLLLVNLQPSTFNISLSPRDRQAPHTRPSPIIARPFAHPTPRSLLVTACLSRGAELHAARGACFDLTNTTNTTNLTRPSPPPSNSPAPGLSTTPFACPVKGLTTPPPWMT